MMVRTLIQWLNGLAMIMLLCTAEVWAQEPGAALVIEKGTTVSLLYTISDERGGVFESNKGGDPVRYVQGQGQMIPGVDRALKGMRVGEKKVLKLEPKDAYGQINPAARVVVPKAMIPLELVKDLRVGAKFLAHAGRQVVPGRVVEIREDAVVVDTNHPLAGKTIIVEIEVTDVILPVPKSQLPAS